MIIDNIVFKIIFEYIFTFNTYSKVAYIAPIRLAQNILKYDFLLLEISPVAYKII